MEKMLRTAPLILFLILSSGCGEGREDHGRQGAHPPALTGVFAVGVSAKDITPGQRQIESGEIHMGGYGYLGVRDFGFPFILSEATAVHDPLFVRAILVELDGRAFAVAVMDAAGIGNRILREIGSMAADATGLHERDIYIANTHSHNAPDLQGYCGGISETYRSFVIDQAVAAIMEANRNRTPAHLYVSTAQGRSGNRRGWGYTDTSITVLEARGIAHDETLCALINFGCHPTILESDDTELSRDYPGYLVDYAEARLGAPVLFVQGALGDATPDTEGLIHEDGFEQAQAFGTLIAGEALASMENQALVDPEWHIDTYTFRPVISNPLLIATYLLFRTQLEYDIEYELLKGLSLQTQVTYARLGNQVQMAVLPGESLTNHALSIKEAMTAPFRMVLSQTSDSLGYLIPGDEWQSAPNGDNYEETFAFDRSLGDATRNHVLDMIGCDPGSSRREFR